MPTVAVTPVIDYEPPTRNLPRRGPSSHAPARPSRPRPHGQPDATPLSLQMREAAVFADAALRRVLEVIDRRRPAGQLSSVLAPDLVDSVLALSQAVSGQGGAAVLRRIRLQAARDTSAEVFGTYSRGKRVHAIACRVERLPDPARWLVMALHIG